MGIRKSYLYFILAVLFAVGAFDGYLGEEKLAMSFGKRVATAPVVANQDFDPVFSKETDLKVVSAEVLQNKVYSSLAELTEEADLIAKVTIIGQSVKVDDDWNSNTFSIAGIESVYKGEAALSSIQIAEAGGPTSNGSSEKVEQSINYIPVMKEGNSYIAFLKQTQDGKFYNVLGSGQGKIKLDISKGILVATVDPLLINDSYYFLQREYAGKPVILFENDIKRTILTN